ncbi:MAG: ATP-binding protein [Halodesulfurarchaeum sp.]
MLTGTTLSLLSLAIPSAPRIAYIVAFGGAAVLCLANLPRASRVEDRDTRVGLQALLVTSGGWAAAHLGFIVASSRALSVAFYVAGLIVGLAAVPAWLYFCSAYTGRSLHRDPTIRRTALAAFAGLIALKLTNPVHNLYFSVGFSSVPFPHTTINTGSIHWVVMGLSYALATVGYFMLFERFQQVGYETKTLGILVAITGLPVLLDVIGFATPLLIDITYEPLGVAVFATGVLFFYLERFQTVRLAGRHDSPVIFLDDEDRIRDFNQSALERFPRLQSEESIGTPLEEIVPTLEGALGVADPIIELEGPGQRRYFQVSENPFDAGSGGTGRALILTDVTEREQYRRKLERQNERLDAFASVVSHDLRNPLNVATGRIELALEESGSEPEDASTEREHLSTALAALERMDALIEDVLTLAREGREIDEVTTVSLADVVDRCWGVVATGDATVSMEDDPTLDADPERLQQLLENLFRNAIEHGGQEVEISVGALDEEPGFYVADDGPGIPADERESVFESGFTTSEEGTGFGLAIVREIAEAHGWDISVTASEAGGARFEIRTAVG